MSDSLVAVSVVGTDRPGIVTGVTEVLYEHGCNLEDVTSTILRGHFAMMLLVRLPSGGDAQTLEAALAPVAESHGLVLSVRPVDEVTGHTTPPTHMISVYGADQPGIVFRVAGVLSDADANITDLTSRVIGSEVEPVYALMLEVTLASEEDISDRLAALRQELGVEISVHPLETDVL